MQNLAVLTHHTYDEKIMFSLIIEKLSCFKSWDPIFTRSIISAGQKRNRWSKISLMLSSQITVTNLYSMLISIFS